MFLDIFAFDTRSAWGYVREMAGPPPSDRPDDSDEPYIARSANNQALLEQSLGSAFARIAPSLELVEATLRDQLASKVELVGTLGSHLLSSGGKRLRPALVLLAAELCGYTGPRRIELAAALELLHTATLLHDDIVDLAEVRRGRAAANAIWGNRRAVLAGDFFYARASSIIVEDGNLEIVESYARTIRLMAEGELLQLERSFDVDVTEAHYYDVIERKSATLLSNCCEIGSLLGGVTRGERNRIREYGRQLGLAFQLRDDCLDYDSDLQELGKEPLADLREGKITLPLILTLKRCPVGEREQVSMALKNASRLADEHGGSVPPDASLGRDLAPVAEMVKRYRGLADTERRAEEHVSKALEAIAPFPDGAAKSALRAAAEFSVARRA